MKNLLFVFVIFIVALFSCDTATYANKGENNVSITIAYGLQDFLSPYVISVNLTKFVATQERQLVKLKGKNSFDLNGFVQCFEELYPNEAIVKLFNLSKCDGLKIRATNKEVVLYLEGQQKMMVEALEKQLTARVLKMTPTSPEISSNLKTGELTLKLNGIKDVNRAIQLLQQTAKLEFYETYQLDQIQYVYSQAMNSCNEIIMAEADSLAGLSSIDRIEQLLQYNGYNLGFSLKQNQDKVLSLLNRREIKDVFPENSMFMWSANPDEFGAQKNQYGLYLIKTGDYLRINNNDIVKASVGLSEQGRFTINIEMTDDGAQRWEEMTENNVGNTIAMTLDGLVYSAPRVMGAITQGTTEISGSFTEREAKDLAAIINAGSYVIPFSILTVK